MGRLITMYTEANYQRNTHFGVLFLFLYLKNIFHGQHFSTIIKI